MLENLKTLCNTDGVSGYEDRVREKIIELIGKAADSIHTDGLGNLIVYKKGAQTPKNKLMFCAHMDEVGFVVTYASEEGFCKFDAVGGIDPSILPGKMLRMQDRDLRGVIGTVPIHLDKDTNQKKIKTDDLYIDFGMNHGVQPGDVLSFDSDCENVGQYICAKAVDDRFGCAALIELIRGELAFDTWFLFSTQEEVGSRGAVAGAFTINPDIAVVVEATTAADLPDVEGSKRVCALGGGPVISFMDKGSIYNKELYDLATKTAEKSNIRWQTKTVIAGGNDAAKIQTTQGGVRTVSMSLPCRYIHSPVCVADKGDMQGILSLLRALLPQLAQA